MSALRFLGCTCVLVFFANLTPSASRAQALEDAVVTGTVTDATGAVVRAAVVHFLVDSDSPGADRSSKTDSAGAFFFAAAAGSYVLRVEAPGFAAFTSQKLVLKRHATVHVPVRLAIASLQQEINVLEDNSVNAEDELSAGLVLQGDTLAMLSDDPSTLKQQLMALAGGMGVSFQIDGFSGTRIPPKASIRSIRIGQSSFSARYSEMTLARVEIDTKPGTDKLHGALMLSGTDQAWDARNPYTQVQAPFSDFQEEGNLNGPLNKKTSFFASTVIDLLANNVVVNAADPQQPSTNFSTALPAPQHAETFSLRVDRQFTQTNFANVRDEWSQTHIVNSGIVPLVLPDAAFTSNILTNTLQLADTQMLGAHAVNDARFQYLRTRTRQDPDSTLPSVVVQGSFQSGGNPNQVLRDNQDAYELQELFEVEHGAHTVHAGVLFRSLRDSNASSAGFNGQYIFPDVASYLAGNAQQYSQTIGQPSAVLSTNDLAVYAEDDWKLTRNLNFSYGLRFESQSAIPDHSDPAPRISFAYAVRPGKRKTPIITLRGGYGIFYDRFPAAQLLQATRQNGTRELAYIAQNTGFNPNGPPPGIVLSAAQPTIYQVDPRLHSAYSQAGSLTVIRSLGRFGTISGNLIYAHNTHNFLTRNANAPLPGTPASGDPAGGTRPLGSQENLYQFASRANGNLERFYLNYHLQLTTRLFAFGVFAVNKNYNESDGVEHFTSNSYNVRQDYGRIANDRAQNYTGGFLWNLPHGVQVTPFLAARSGLPFDITTGADNNGDTIYNDRPGLASNLAGASMVRTQWGVFDTFPVDGQALYPRNAGTSPGFIWLDLKVSKDFRVGPRPRAAAANPGAKSTPPPDRPWTLSFSVDAQNLTNHNNPGLPVGAISAQTCGSGVTAPCSCPVVGVCPLAPSRFFGHSISLANDLTPVTASNRTILLQTSFSF